MWVVFAVVSAVGNATRVSLSLFMLLCRVFMVVTAVGYATGTRPSLFMADSYLLKGDRGSS